MPEMKEAQVKTSFLDAELVAASERRVERKKTEEAILELRKRLGGVIQDNVIFPDQVEGKKIVLIPGFYSKGDWVDDGTASYKELSSTTLICRPVKKENKKISYFPAIYIHPEIRRIFIIQSRDRLIFGYLSKGWIIIFLWEGEERRVFT